MAVRSAREAAYETIRSRIITMELKPGDELNDHELAQELGISRTPMREALIMLNIAHMVTIKPQSGTHVAPIDLHLMELEQFSRYTLEKEILNRIRGRLTAEQEAAMAESDQSYIDQYGSEEAFEAEIAKLGMRRETYDRVARSNYLYQDLYELYNTEGSALYASDEDLAVYAADQNYITFPRRI